MIDNPFVLHGEFKVIHDEYLSAVDSYLTREEAESYLQRNISGYDLNGRKIVKSFKWYIKNHYVREQDYKCCYCLGELGENTGDYHLEHIIPFKLEPKFFLNPLNLAASCLSCNSGKSSSDVVFGGVCDQFPEDSADYRIVHPHFDRYEDFIRIDEVDLGVDSFRYYSGIDELGKGVFTIRMCNLSRFIGVDETKCIASHQFQCAANEYSQKISIAKTSSEIDSIVDEFLDIFSK